MAYMRSIRKRSRGELEAVADTEGSLQLDTLIGLKQFQFPLLPRPSSTLLPCKTVDMFEKLQVTHGADF